ncbi:MAG: VCBS repeat-containing protein [Candidatus Neomarinimicrobiota bacterium]
MKPVRFILCLAVYCLTLSAQNMKIIHMEGTFDLDGDGLQEFATIEEKIMGDHKKSVIRYYEMDEDGFQRVTWELEAPDGMLGSFVDVKLADLDGEGVPELITIINLAEPGQEEMLIPMAYYYYWDGEKFSTEAGGVINLAEDRKFLRCFNFALMDYDGDSDQEIIVSLGSPLREFRVLDLDEDGEWEIRQKIKPNGMRSGIGFLFAGITDWDRDGYDDVIGFSVEGNILRTQPYYNEGENLINGPGSDTQIPGMDGLIPQAITETDWDGDGFLDILLPFRNGMVLALTLSDGMLAVEKLPVESGPLSDLKIADFNQDGYDDLLLVSGELNIITLIKGTRSGLSEVPEYFALKKDNQDTQVFTVLPVMIQGVYTGSVIAAGWDGNETTLFITDMGHGPEPEEPAFALEESGLDQEDILDVFPIIPDESFTLPPIPSTLDSRGQPLPKGILPRHVLSVNQAFAYTLPEEEKQEFYSFRWLKPPPKGMFFHYDSRSIRWVPDETQLGAYKIAYHVERKIGEEVIPLNFEEDSLLSYKVVAQLAGDDERLWIYVNDPPLIITEPLGTEFVSTTEFVYKPIVTDRNIDSKLSWDLEISPEGMTINENGHIYWATDSSHVDVYDVRLVVSDGFDRVAQEFRLFARAGVRILSEPAREGKVDDPYRYKVDIWRPNLEHILSYKLLQAPEGMTISDSGLVEWTPSVQQIDIHKFTVEVGHGVARDTQNVDIFVNHPPVLESLPQAMNVIKLGEEYRFQIEAYDPNQDDGLIYTALEMPDGMRMDPYTALLFWEPGRENIDFSHLSIEVTDGREIRMIEADFFVNAPINIVSIPPMQATVGESYRYEVMSSDMNRSTLLPFDRIIPLKHAENFRVYSITISDDVYIENIDRYLMDWEIAPAVYLTESGTKDSLEVSRLNLKKYVKNIFWERDRLNVILEAVDDRTVAIKDVLWEFFQGAKGRPPRVTVQKMSTIRYTLTEFPDGMEIDEYSGIIKWTPTGAQVDYNNVNFVISDGYTKDEQSFEIYANHVPVIISNPPVAALTGEVFKYQLQVEDKNEDADLVFALMKAPQGMQMSKLGKIVWIPKASQINENTFSVQVSDGYREDIQTSKVFVNINPSIISTPKPVALTGHNYIYRIVAEDLNRDKIAFRAVKLPKYSTFNRKTGVFRWKPKPSQRGPNDIIITAVDERGSTTAHEFQIHVFEDPSARRMINTGWPLLISFVGVIFTWGLSQL